MIFAIIPALLVFLICGTRCFYKLFFRYIGLKKIYLFALSAFLFIAAFLLLMIYGDVTFGFIVNLLICFAFSDLAGFVLKIKKIRDFVHKSYLIHKYGQTVLVTFLALLLTVYGYFNAVNVNVKKYHIDIEKPDFKSVRIMFVSDVHINNAKKEAVTSEILKTAGEYNPDVVIFGGDLVDQSSEKDALLHIAGAIEEIKKDSVVIYVYGNHDGAGGNISRKYIEEILEGSGAYVLADEVFSFRGIDFIGREDFSCKLRGGERKSINDLIYENENVKILIDHQPKELDKLNNAGVDVSLSGHTHNGQIFPLGILCSLFDINEMQYGIRNNTNTVSVVSSGISTWGMRVRTQGNSEIVILDIS